MADISNLRAIMRRLRDRDHGCPWDLEQTYRTIVPHTLEEAYEVADTIESGRLVALPGELGDLLFQVVFYCQLAEEEGRFSFDEVVNELEVKLTSRHPHVFGDAVSEDSAAVSVAWETHKAQERARADATSEMDDVPLALPALSRARKVQKRASRVGFDWPDEDGAWAKLGEELSELRDALDSARGHGAVHDELGDVLFSLVNVARHLDVEPESSLRDATAKFERRFRALEAQVAEHQTNVESAGPELLNVLWEAVKRGEKKMGAEAPKIDQGEERGRD